MMNREYFKITENNETKKIFVFLFFLLFVFFVFLLATKLGWIDILNDQNNMKTNIQQVGALGPLFIILLISVAVVISPIPSAPIALVSGALYGHTLGTVYIIIGAIAGALIAFIIARKLGHDFFKDRFNSHFAIHITGSQNTMMFIVFISRLAPFISFDVISYAAGLTSLSIQRFLIATTMGIIPISFVLAHLGSEVSTGELESIAFALLMLGVITVISLLLNKLYQHND